MREIKFRAWDGERLKQVTLWGFHEGFIMTSKGSMDEDEYKVMQYTGLKDKNGIEIYEGDLITIMNPFIKQEAIGVAEIVFSHEYVGGWVAQSANDYLNIGTRTHMISVVGNKYENPELLTEG